MSRPVVLDTKKQATMLNLREEPPNGYEAMGGPFTSERTSHRPVAKANSCPTETWSLTLTYVYRTGTEVHFKASSTPFSNNGPTNEMTRYGYAKGPANSEAVRHLASIQPCCEDLR